MKIKIDEESEKNTPRMILLGIMILIAQPLAPPVPGHEK